MLNISQNRVASMQGLASLQTLIALNMGAVLFCLARMIVRVTDGTADENGLDEFTVQGSMPRLRILRVSGNHLQTLDVGPLPSLRTLYADNNALAGLAKVVRLRKLENLSLRNQRGRGL